MPAGGDPSKDTARGSGPGPSTYGGSRRWSRRQAATTSRHLLDESSNEEDTEDAEANGKEEGSSQGEGRTMETSEEGERGAHLL
ncbi:UNVERIFIED_CONTAM: hypothetical protein Sradi_4389700 [Sesamum radiatum]|uniref:Uncharacterized protein n=1 Tax=Sesamum radiatum TaxID=300843 RepID=A0AAW2NPX2_SESRA